MEIWEKQENAPLGRSSEATFFVTKKKDDKKVKRTKCLYHQFIFPN